MNGAQRRAPIDGVNSHGDTALMPSTRVRNADGLSALDIARRSTDESLVKLLD
jgi:hypothetical protein